MVDYIRKTAPTDPSKGESWKNPDTDVVKHWDGSAWAPGAELSVKRDVTGSMEFVTKKAGDWTSITPNPGKSPSFTQSASTTLGTGRMRTILANASVRWAAMTITPMSGTLSAIVGGKTISKQFSRTTVEMSTRIQVEVTGIYTSPTLTFVQHIGTGATHCKLVASTIQAAEEA